MKLFKHIYYHGDKYLCEEWVNDDMDYKIQLELEMLFYLDDENEWHTEYGSFDLRRKLRLKLKMWKMVGDEIHYKSDEVMEELDFSNYDEW